MWGLFMVEHRSPYRQTVLRSFTDIKTNDTVFGIFKTKQQALNALREVVKEKGLCPHLLGTESGKGACFSHQLGICKGACVQKIDAVVYNILFEQAFAKRKLRLWPYPTAKKNRFH